jgi:L-alanine-DL-glutamate epimerase-like enolase superfamily enzyme
VYQLLGGARREAIVPYATIWPGAPDGRSLEELMGIIEGQLGRAIELGFRAVKMELIFGHVATDRQLIDCIREGRRAVGDDITLMLDFGYRWHDWRAALWTLDRVQDCDIYFAEATLQHDDLVGHAKLAARVETRLAGAELAATVFECREWIERGGVDVLQPDVSRSGGLTELVRIAELAAAAGVLVVPHGWKTGITAAASRHFQAAVPNVPFVETLVPELWPSPLAADLVTPRPHVCDGAIALPDAPGLGIELVPQTLERWRLDPMV